MVSTVRPMANIRTLTDARKVARELHAQQEQERAERDRLRTEDVAVLLIARTRLAAVDQWAADQIAKIGVDADRRRSEHTRTASEAVQRMRARGDSIKTIAGGSGMTEAQIRKLAARRGIAAAQRSAPTEAAQPDAQAVRAEAAAVDHAVGPSI